MQLQAPTYTYLQTAIIREIVFEIVISGGLSPQQDRQAAYNQQKHHLLLGLQQHSKQHASSGSFAGAELVKAL